MSGCKPINECPPDTAVEVGGYISDPYNRLRWGTACEVPFTFSGKWWGGKSKKKNVSVAWTHLRSLPEPPETT